MNQPRPGDENPPKGYELSGKIMLSAIVIIFVVVVFMVILHVYARWYLIRLRRSDIHRRRNRSGQILVYVDPNNPVATAQTTSGLDASVLRALPVFAYMSKTNPGALECAVCLSEFEEGEKGRVLPKCEHSFHLDCIDMWFQSHSTCPICRSPVEPQDPANPTQAIVSEPGSSSGFCSTCEEGQSNSTSLADRRKGFDLVGVRIEVPRRGECVGESGVSSPAIQGFKSPPSRLMSLKRILSMGRKTPSSGVDENSSHVGPQIDVELGKNELTQGQGQTQTREYTPR